MPSELVIEQVLLGDLDNFTYLVGDRLTREAVIIDPSASRTEIAQILGKDGWVLKGILLTHGHYDHVVDVEQATVPVYLSALEASSYTPKASQLVRIKDGETLMVGGITITCWATPGHTPGCQCFLVENNIFTGDTLFVDAVGRTDFPGGDTRTLYASLQRIKSLPDDTGVWPGHHYGALDHARLGQLKTTNPYLACEDINKFMRYL